MKPIFFNIFSILGGRKTLSSHYSIQTPKPFCGWGWQTIRNSRRIVMVPAPLAATHGTSSPHSSPRTAASVHLGICHCRKSQYPRYRNKHPNIHVCLPSQLLTVTCILFPLSVARIMPMMTLRLMRTWTLIGYDPYNFFVRMRFLRRLMRANGGIGSFHGSDACRLRKGEFLGELRTRYRKVRPRS